ncbi:MAG TPA: TetR/AcrR family transcriptional regulator [Pseudolysinimonas sp.]|nr:TetR/AcrR family transcriptional regulator [Pseudolysinimonas sp.]
MSGPDDAARIAVLDAADRLFYGKGVQAVGMDELRSEAGISLKRIYALFSSKDEILRQVLTRRNEEWTRRVLAHASTATTPRDKLLSVYDFLEEWFREDDFRGCAFINSFGELGSVDPEVASFARHHKESFQRYLAEVAKTSGAPDYLAPQLALLAEGAQTTAAISGTADAAAQARAAAATLIDAALAATAA